MKPFLCLLLVAWAVPVFSAPPAVVSSGVQSSMSAAGNSFNPTFSADGQHLVFVSHANNLVTNDDLGSWLDVFVRDLVSSNTVLVSVGTGGIGGANADANFPSVSSNGQFIAFASRASNLTPGDTNGGSDVFIRDVNTGLTRLVSVDLNGNPPADPSPTLNTLLSGYPLVSGDGRWVFFESRATNLIASGAPLGSVNIYARDTWSNVTVLVTADTNGYPLSGVSVLASITPDARFTAFRTTNNTVVLGVTNTSGDVYVRDLQTSATIWASANLPAYFNAPYHTLHPALSATGQFVAFMAGASVEKVFRHDLASNITLLVSSYLGYGGAGTAASNTGSGLQISDNGSRIAYEAERQVYVWSAQSNASQRVNLCDACCNVPGAGNAPDNSSRPSLSADGRYISFVSSCDSTFASYRRDLLTTTTEPLVPGASAGIGLAYPVLSPDGTRAAFDLVGEAIVPDDLNGMSDVFVRDVNAGVTELITKAQPTKPAATSFAHSFLGLNSVSSDGRRIVSMRFDDPSAFLDTNNWADVFVSDTASNTTVAVSINAASPVENTNVYRNPVINANGTLVAAVRLNGNGIYTSIVGTGITNGTFVSSGLSQLAYVSYSSGSGNSDSPVLNADGSLLVFRSDSTDFNIDGASDGLDANNASDVWLRYPVIQPYQFNPMRQYYVALSGFGAGAPTGNGPSFAPAMSADGNKVVFATKAGNLLPSAAGGTGGPQFSSYQIMAAFLDTNRAPTNYFFTIPKRLCSYTISFQQYVWIDSVNTNIYRTNLNALLTPITTDVTNAIFSANNRYVIYSLADGSAVLRHDLLATQTNYTFVRHASGSNFLGSIVATNVVPGAANALVCANCRAPSVSADGNVVAYERVRAGTSLVDLFAKDLLTGAETLVSGNLSGALANGSSTSPFISGDGRYVVFQSKASDLVANDTNSLNDIFVRDRLLGVTMLASANAQGRAGNGPSARPVLAADGRTVVFQSFASDLVTGDYNDKRDVFVLKLGGADLDHDGMDDDWEMAYFNTTARDGTGDFDSDGVSDKAEFLAGTDPTNANSVFRVLTLQPSGGGARLLLWSGNPARSYRVEFKDDLGAVGWTALSGTISWNGSTASIPDLSASSATNRYYRVLRLP